MSAPTDPSKGSATIGGPVTASTPGTGFDSGKRNSPSGSVPGHPTAPPAALTPMPSPATPAAPAAPGDSSTGAYRPDGSIIASSGQYQGAPAIAFPRGPHPTTSTGTSAVPSAMTALGNAATALQNHSPEAAAAIRNAATGMAERIRDHSTGPGMGDLATIRPAVRAALQSVGASVRTALGGAGGGGVGHIQPVGGIQPPDRAASRAARRARIAARVAARLRP